MIIFSFVLHIISITPFSSCHAQFPQKYKPWQMSYALQWSHNESNGISNHRHHWHCLPNRLFRRRPMKTSKLHVTGLCEGNWPMTGEFPAQRASHVENISIWWRHRDVWCIFYLSPCSAILYGIGQCYNGTCSYCVLMIKVTPMQINVSKPIFASNCSLTTISTAILPQPR